MYESKLLTVFSPYCVLCVRVCVFHCLSRIPVQRPGAGGGGGPRPGSAAAAPRAGGRQLLLPASLRPADVHHTHAVQQENGHQRQGQRNRGGQSRLPVSSSVFILSFFFFNRNFYSFFKSLITSINVCQSPGHSCLQREHLLWVYLDACGLHWVRTKTTCYFLYDFNNNELKDLNG